METASKILYEGGQGEIIEKKSRFIANIFPVTTEEEALEKNYRDAEKNIMMPDITALPIF